MAKYSSNGVYLNWNGVNVSAKWTGQTNFTPTNSPTNVSAGANATHEEWNPGLNATGMAFNLYFDDDQAERAAYIGSLESGTKGTLIYGPQGNAAGKPVHEQVMIVTAPTGPNAGQAKDVFQMIELTLLGAAAPVRTINSDVFA